MRVIDLIPEMVYGAAKRDYYNVLAVENVESVVLQPVAADPPPSLNALHYTDVKVKVVIVNVNRSGGRNVNVRCGGGGGRGGSKEEKDNNAVIIRGRGGGANVAVNNNFRTLTRSLPAMLWYTSPTYSPSSDPFGVA